MSCRIINNTRLNASICKIKISAPAIAAKALPGQFVILRIDEKGERIPITIYQSHAGTGEIELIVQEAGWSTLKLCSLKAQNDIADILGPLGNPSQIKKYGKVLCVAGGVGVAEIYPVAEALNKAGNQVYSIIGARSKDLLILEKEMEKISRELYVTTDDGSHGHKGYVTDILKGLILQENFDIVFVVGPVVMMKNVSEVTRKTALKTIVSLNSIMVDGTGMCGSCRVTVGAKVRFTCVHGPEFDGHLVDFDEMLKRQDRFLTKEKYVFEKANKKHKPCHKTE